MSPERDSLSTNEWGTHELWGGKKLTNTLQFDDC